MKNLGPTHLEACLDLFHRHVDGYHAADRAERATEDRQKKAVLAALRDIQRELAVERQIDMEVRPSSPEEREGWADRGRRWWDEALGALQGGVPQRLQEVAADAAQQVIESYDNALPAAAELRPQWVDGRDRLLRILRSLEMLKEGADPDDRS